ncbi:uncharacterized protein JCM10292_000027 [Rhodotorula paludigena]|uniref:uncharacterized protein n=1 Tax=Rhodotorula paludigena TaxID=86838 RepID=UPI0031710BA3
MADVVAAQRNERNAAASDHDDEKRSVSDIASTEPEQVGPTYKSRGVIGVEAIARAAKESASGRKSLWLLAACVYITNWIAAMAASVTASFSVYATSSFNQHSNGLAMLSVATSIIGSVSLPFLAKASDVWSRPGIYGVCLIAQIVGYIIILKSPTLGAYVVGNVAVTIGRSGYTQINSTLIADLTPLKYRGLAQGLITTPYLATVWFTSEIVQALSAPGKWRWGYGMYAIIFAVTWTPAIFVMWHLERRAIKSGLVDIDTARTGADDTKVEKVAKAKVPIYRQILQVANELDTVGLILMGFGWSLILLPFSLAPQAKGGWNNPSMIAMLVVGALCLLCFPLYEWKVARYPSAPNRLLRNRTFVTAVIIDFIYMLAGYLQLLYIASYCFIVTDITPRNWNYFNNVLNMGQVDSLCGFGVIAGLLMRYTHRYKFVQIAGISVRIIGYGLLVDKAGSRNLARLVMSQFLAGAGSAFSVIGSQVGSQASVPHQDVALAISLLSLWSSIGAAIGNSIASQVWQNNMPGNLRQYIPTGLANDTQIAGFFADITSIKAYDFNSDVRQGAIKAYEETCFPLWAAALGLSFLALLAACFQTNFYLGDSQNSFDHKDTAGHVVKEARSEHVEATGWRRYLRFWDL